MNERPFDRLTRYLTTDHHRRGLLGTAAGAVTVLLARDPDVALASCKKVGKKCDKNKDCCDGAKCKGKKCKCKSGWGDCNGNGKCEKLNNDDANCGACGNVCAADESCQSGDCQVCIPNTPAFESSTETCGSNTECCGNGLCCTFNEPGGAVSGCYDLLTNTTACGLTCDTAVNCLNTNQVCVDGQCVDP